TNDKLWFMLSAGIHSPPRTMKKASTYFLRFAIFVIGLMVLALCVFALPAAWPGAVAEFPYAVLSIRLIIIGLYLATVPFYVALWQALKLLRLIDENKAFAEVSVAALRTIKRCATLITGIFVVFVPLLFPIAEVDD